MEVATIAIACQGATTVGLDEVNDLQGNLKDLNEAQYVKLRNSIMQYGFSFPLFIWVDSEGKKWIIDAHQRVRTLRKMQQEGYTIPPLPADLIFAENRKEAKEKLLLLNSRYGKFDLPGYEEFIHEEGSELSGSEFYDLLEIPELTMWDTPPAPSQTTQPDGPEDVQVEQTVTRELDVTCPSCQHVFKITP
jgi:hypothetical protein